MLVYLIKCVFGPELYRIYRKDLAPGRNYNANNLEYFSNSVLSFFKGFYVLCKWTSPIIFAFAYNRGYFSVEGLQSLTRLSCLFGFIIISAYVTRGYGRMKNKDYLQFIRQYIEINKLKKSSERQKFLSEYDFEMKNWQPDYISTSKPPLFKNIPHRLIHTNPIDTVKYSIWRVLSLICVDTFGLRMMYPGVVIQNLIGQALLDGRSKLIEKKKAKRAFVQTSDSYRNKIDTLFIDQRNQVRYSSPSNINTLNSFTNNSSNESNGNYLVICCDGNASFYEVGCFQIPIENGYSAIGWNYPGFGQSTGLPYPKQVTAAADAVMQYAFSLGFKQENIILFSWSIGGFAASWLSNHYPDVRAVVLDACFDNITPLAQQQMPKFASDFVNYAIRHNLNLDVAELISKYNGPVLFIRRTQDEIISTIPRVAASNRGNELLINTLKKRYPYIINEDTLPFIRTWLSAKSEADRVRILSSYTSENVHICESIMASFIINNNKYPIELGKNNKQNESDNNNGDDLIISKDYKLTLALYLADKYLINFESSHCQPLLKEYFRIPWSEQELLERRYKF